MVFNNAPSNVPPQLRQAPPDDRRPMHDAWRPTPDARREEVCKLPSLAADEEAPTRSGAWSRIRSPTRECLLYLFLSY